MVIKVAVPHQFKLKVIPDLKTLFFVDRKDIHYIGGSDILPAPLEAAAEKKAIKDLGTEKDENARLDRFTLLKIKSLAPQDLIFKPISWGIDVGYEHFKQRSDYLKVKPEVGVTFGQNRDFIYLMAGSNLYYKNSEQLYSIGSTIGFITNRFDKIKPKNKYTLETESDVEEFINELKSKMIEEINCGREIIL